MTTWDHCREWFVFGAWIGFVVGLFVGVQLSNWNRSRGRR